jgi:N-formylglutamate deformylase
MMDNDIFLLRRGSAPLVVSLPHVGLAVPEGLRENYVPRAMALEDTDWHLVKLYAFAVKLGASVIAATHSRYVIDLNRPPDDAPMYPGASNTELCPTRFFTGEPLYREGGTPSPSEIDRRRLRYWWPYHIALRSELDRVKALHGHVIHWDGHSIRSQIPWLFEGTLPALNVGTANSTSCARSLLESLTQTLRSQSEFGFAIDGRFKGGYTTRHYGRPAEGIHTVQMEMCQATYMEEAPPFTYDEPRAAKVQRVLRTLLETALEWRPEVSVRA